MINICHPRMFFPRRAPPTPGSLSRRGARPLVRVHIHPGEDDPGGLEIVRGDCDVDPVAWVPLPSSFRAGGGKNTKTRLSSSRLGSRSFLCFVGRVQKGARFLTSGSIFDLA